MARKSQPRQGGVRFAIGLPGLWQGRLAVSYREGKLTRVEFIRGIPRGSVVPKPRLPRAERDMALERRLRNDFLAYFSGRKVSFDYRLDVAGFTPFRKAVWAAMKKIPYGQTRSYRWVAEKVGRPRAFRAVGNACAKNPMVIIVPCHRVVGSDGRLGGFSAGLDLKRALLELEGLELR